jgi:hypothetical protein
MEELSVTLENRPSIHTLRLCHRAFSERFLLSFVMKMSNLIFFVKTQSHGLGVDEEAETYQSVGLVESGSEFSFNHLF